MQILLYHNLQAQYRKGRGELNYHTIRSVSIGISKLIFRRSRKGKRRASSSTELATDEWDSWCSIIMITRCGDLPGDLVF